MNKEIEFDKVVLTEKSIKEFSKKVKVTSYTNANILEYLEFKYFFIGYNASIVGYVILGEVFNKNTNKKNWILLNIEVYTEFRGCNIGNITLGKIHKIFISELNVSSYIIALNSYIMYKMIVKEFKNRVVDFYCLINTKYPVEEMKAEEKYLEQVFKQNPNVHADMVVSFDKEESERVKSFYFKQL
jgi:hypothetical protein